MKKTRKHSSQLPILSDNRVGQSKEKKNTSLPTRRCKTLDQCTNGGSYVNIRLEISRGINKAH